MNARATGGDLNRTLASCLPDERQPAWRRILFVALVAVSLALILPAPAVVSDVSHTTQPFPAAAGRTASVAAAPAVWIVESTDAHELYSNGLRIETSFAARNRQRFYQIFDRAANFAPSPEWHSWPAGIVFHLSESPQAPFEAEQNDALQRMSRALLRHVRENRSYNYVIDKFGRVHRVVEEVDAAHHAGNSVWALGNAVYIGLNDSFLGVSFESAGETPLTSAQVHAGRLLTQLLRNRYRIPVENCITHAQVSVNPSNMRIGYHTDGARGFPFIELGLANNFELPLAAIAEFGFNYDDAFRKAAGPQIWRGILTAERAAGADREALQARYRRLYAAVKDAEE